MIYHDIDAGPCSRGRAQTQAFPAKCLDESFAFQYENLVPQGWASSMVYWTLRWAYHTGHRAPLHRRDHAGAAIFMRSTPGCGTLAGPSLEWVAFRSPRPNGFAERSSLKRPGALGRPEMPTRYNSWENNHHLCKDSLCVLVVVLEALMDAIYPLDRIITVK